MSAEANRIEKAFASAKERNEAAFVTFVTAGYPTAQGTFEVVGRNWLVLRSCIGLLLSAVIRTYH
jgi:Tryptophan synthase alpha chain